MTITIYTVEVDRLDEDGKSIGWETVGESENEAEAKDIAIRYENCDIVHGQTRITPVTHEFHDIINNQRP